MTIRLSFFLITIFIPFQVNGHCQSPAEAIPAMPRLIEDARKALLFPASAIRTDSVLNENLLNLVHPWMADSVVRKKTERHHVPLMGSFSRLFGFRWLRVYQTKQKFIGTTWKNLRIPEKDLFTEYDVIIDLAAHLPEHFEKHFRCRELQAKMNKRLKEQDINKPPFVRPDSSTNLNVYRMHCELTPAIPLRESIHRNFYPCLPGGSFESHRNFGEKFPTIGMYGAICLDCNHSCHPEIHPYEWIWWLNLNPELDSSDQRTWIAGMFSESSNRFRHWSPANRSGAISIPFTTHVSRDTFDIFIEALVAGEIDTISFAKLSLPNEATAVTDEAQFFSFPTPAKNLVFRIHFIGGFPAKGVSWWIGETVIDELFGMISGNFHIAAGVKDAFAFAVRFSM